MEIRWPTPRLSPAVLLAVLLTTSASLVATGRHRRRSKRWATYRTDARREIMAAMSIPSVLFVCMGNICRSPTGEGLFRAHLADSGLDDAVEVDSAGTIAYHSGDPADARMREAAERRGYRLESRARQVRADDLEQFDLILAMDRQNLADLRRLAADHGAGTAELRLMSDFLPADARADHGVDVPDPYYGGSQGFETVLDMIEAACPALLDELLGGRASATRETVHLEGDR